MMSVLLAFAWVGTYFCGDVVYCMHLASCVSGGNCGVHVGCSWGLCHIHTKCFKVV